MVVLGISAYYHDSSAALIVDGVVVAAAAEERFSRKKHDNSFPTNAIIICIQEAKLTLDAIDHVVFYEKPLLKFERLLTTNIHCAPYGLNVFLKSMPIWLNERLNMTQTISRHLDSINGNKRKWDIRYVEHHISHAAMAFYSSGYMSSAILVIDAVGENATTSIIKGDANGLKIIKQQIFPNSIGLLYSSFTYFLGFKVNSDEYKVMGLAPYGDLQNPQTQRFIDIIENKLVDIAEDGSIVLNQKYFAFMHSMTMVKAPQWERLFGTPCRQPNAPITQQHKNLAAAIQSVIENIIFRLAKHSKEITGESNLCVTGGCALNCAAMGKIKSSGIFDNVFVPFAPGDDGGAIGAAMALSQITHSTTSIHIPNPYLGKSYSDIDILETLSATSLIYEELNYDNLYIDIAKALSSGKIVGWFQGRMEFGPRALGNRSILADARNPQMKDIVNDKVKFRESFRPFAPIVIQDEANKYFGMGNSPYMMFTTNVKSGTDNLPATTHIDRSARVQTVTMEQNQRIYKLLLAFKSITGCPVLLNTSFNVMGEPIVGSPNDAIRTFQNSGIDILVMNNFIIRKQ